MLVLSHRGYWLQRDERNTRLALQRSFDAGYGTETDLRDAGGEIVISHDPPVGGEVTFDGLLELLGDRQLPLALNIKADGLADRVESTLAAHGVTTGFVFDMSVPDARTYHGRVPAFTRVSEEERVPAWLTQSEGIWLDSFGPTWFGVGEIEEYLERGLRVCVVSSELHGREPDALWEMLRPVAAAESLMLCTDLPVAATTYFSEVMP